jgi:hypothetical protein
LVFATQKYPPSGTILVVVAKGHPWPSTPQLGIPPNCPPKSHLHSAKRRALPQHEEPFKFPAKQAIIALQGSG